MEQSMPLHKQIFVVCMLLIVIFSTYRIFLNMSNTNELTTNHSRNLVVDTHQAEIARTSEAISPASSEATQGSLISYADAQDNIAWHADRGYFSFEEQETYKRYDLSSLKDLARNGDIRALNELATRSIEEGDFLSAKEYFWDAAARGNSAVLLNLARLQQTSNDLNVSASERKVNERLAVLEGMAILEVASLRGDAGVASVGRKIMNNTYQFTTGEALELSSEENELILLRAEELYQDLLKKRHQLGLGDFDNSTTKVAKELYKNL